MIQNNNTSVLPFYNSISHQNHRKDYAFGNVWDLLVPVDRLIPFQIIRDHSATGITGVKLFNFKGVQVADLTAVMNISVIRFDDIDVIVYAALFPTGVNLPEGRHYLVLESGTEKYYSDVFTLVLNTDCFLKLEWSDLSDIIWSNGRIVYSNNFVNRIYLQTELGKPDYPFTDDVETRDGLTFPIKQLSEKTYKFVFTAPEYVCDVLRLVRLTDNIYITNKGAVYKADSFLMTPDWQTQGDIAAITCEFQTDTVVVKKIAKGVSDGHDFNGDFNIDFDTDGFPEGGTRVTIRNISTDATITSFTPGEGGSFPVTAGRSTVRWIDAVNQSRNFIISVNVLRTSLLRTIWTGSSGQQFVTVHTAAPGVSTFTDSIYLKGPVMVEILDLPQNIVNIDATGATAGTITNITGVPLAGNTFPVAFGQSKNFNTQASGAAVLNIGVNNAAAGAMPKFLTVNGVRYLVDPGLQVVTQAPTTIGLTNSITLRDVDELIPITITNTAGSLMTVTACNLGYNWAFPISPGQTKTASTAVYNRKVMTIDVTLSGSTPVSHLCRMIDSNGRIIDMVVNVSGRKTFDTADFNANGPISVTIAKL